MIKTPLLLLSLLFAIATSSFADEKKSDSAKAEMFQKRKEQMTKDLDGAISDMQTLKSCVASASDHEAMKKCHDEKRKRMMEHKDNHMEQKKQMIEERIKHLEEEKANLDKKGKEEKK